MPSFAAPVDLLKNELRNAVTQNLGTPPSSPSPGLRYYDTVANEERYWNGTTWVGISAAPTGLGALAYLDEVGSAEITDLAITDADVSASAAIALSKLATDPLARANHTGTQLAATISDLGALATLDQVGTAEIANDAITDAQVSPTAAIALSKLATDPLDRANHTGTQPASTITGLGALALLDQVGTAEIAAGSVTDASVSATAAIQLSKLAVDPLDRANHTGTQLAATISDLGALALLDQVGTAEIAAGAVTDGQVSPTAAIALSKLATDPLDRANHTGSQTAATISDFDTQVQSNTLNSLAIPDAPLNLGGQTLVNLATPVNPADGANKAYVDNVAQGLDVKESCRVLSATNVDLSSAPATIDGVTLAAGDRVLLIGQTDTSANGIYEFAGSGSALARSADADSDADVNAGMYTFITEGNYADEGWILHTPDPITLGTTPLEFTQFSGAGTVVGTTDRISVIGNQVDIDAAYVGQSSLTTLGTVTTGTWNGDPIDIAFGGTNATDATTARLNLGAISKYASTIGDGSAIAFTVTHNLNTTQVGVEVYDIATGATVYVDVKRADANTVTINGFGNAPASGSLGVIVWG